MRTLTEQTARSVLKMLIEGGFVDEVTLGTLLGIDPESIVDVKFLGENLVIVMED